MDRVIVPIGNWSKAAKSARLSLYCDLTEALVIKVLDGNVMKTPPRI